MLAKQGKKIKMVKKPGGGFKMTFVPIVEPEEPESENESINEGPAELKKVETIMLTLMKLGRKITDRKQAEKLGAALSNISFLRDMMKNESINEGKYHEYRNDDTLSPKQKIGYSMREVRDKLNELDKLVKMNVRLKNEVGVNSTDYWKNTHNAMKKISERLVKLANKVGQLY